MGSFVRRYAIVIVIGAVLLVGGIFALAYPTPATPAVPSFENSTPAAPAPADPAPAPATSSDNGGSGGGSGSHVHVCTGTRHFRVCS